MNHVHRTLETGLFHAAGRFTWNVENCHEERRAGHESFRKGLRNRNRTFWKTTCTIQNTYRGVQ